MTTRVLLALLLAPILALTAGCTGNSHAAQPAPSAAAAPPKIKVLVATGGHGFTRIAFLRMLDRNPDIAYTFVAQKTNAEVYNRDDLLSYDVLLLYDFQRNLTDAQKLKFLSLFDKGIGVVVLHHALLSYQTWPEYERIAGGKYLLDVENNNGMITPESTYKGNVDIAVKVADPAHPVTAGIKDFVLHDEIYRGVRMRPDIHALLTFEGNPLAWTRIEKNSRVVGIIVGHGPAYVDPNFQRLLRQSIAWVARRT